jgi:hypothetical protein
MQNVTILYQGGSGGFALYYYLLLTGKYQFDIPVVQEMIKTQYPLNLIDNPYRWKQTEIWPDNNVLKESKKPSVFLICNPFFCRNMLDINQYISHNTHKILLYTNIHLQLRMAYDKQAYWFTDVSRKQFNAPDDNRKYFKQILKESTDNLDPMVKKIKEVFVPDQCVQLEDFIKTQELIGEPSTAVQKEFLDYWYQLQTSKIRNLLMRN